MGGVVGEGTVRCVDGFEPVLYPCVYHIKLEQIAQGIRQLRGNSRTVCVAVLREGHGR